MKNARVVFAQQSSLLATMLMCDCHLAPKAGLLFVLGAALTLLQCPIVLLMLCAPSMCLERKPGEFNERFRSA